MIPALTAGGAERVLSTLCSWWAERGHSVTLITLGATGSDFYPLHRDVRRVGLDLLGRRNRWSAVSDNLRRIRSLRRAIVEARPDVVVSFIDTMNVLTILACRGLATPVVVSERIFPPLAEIGPLWTRLRDVSYRWADAVVVQTERAREWVASIGTGARVFVLPNPLSETFVAAALPVGRARTPTVVAMGRLAHQKRFDLLIDAFSRVSDAHPEWSLRIYGEGEARATLERLAAERGRGRVSLPGKTTVPSTVLSESGIFALSSAAEGFPNVLLEAMACGCPVVSTDCPSGPAELIDEGVTGFLVPVGDAGAFAAALDRLMSDAPLRERIGSAARSVATRFDLDVVAADWSAALESMAGSAA